MQHLNFTEEPPHRFPTLLEIHLGRRRPRHHHNLSVVNDLGAVRPIKFPQVPLHPVADYGRAYLARYGKSKFATLTFPPDHVAYKGCTHALAAVLKRRLEIPLAREALMPWKRLEARHNSSTSSPLRGQTLAALRATALYHTLARCRRHALQKAVVPLPLQFRWLIGPFHDTLLASAPLAPQPYQRGRQPTPRHGPRNKKQV